MQRFKTSKPYSDDQHTPRTQQNATLEMLDAAIGEWGDCGQWLFEKQADTGQLYFWRVV